MAFQVVGELTGVLGIYKVVVRLLYILEGHQVFIDEVYGDLPLNRSDLFFAEETPIHTSSKVAADLLVLAYHRT